MNVKTKGLDCVKPRKGQERKKKRKQKEPDRKRGDNVTPNVIEKKNETKTTKVLNK